MDPWACDCSMTVWCSTFRGLFKEKISSLHLYLSLFLSPTLCVSLYLLSSVSRDGWNILYIYMWEKSEVERDRVQGAWWCTLIFFSVSWKCSSKQAILKPWNAHQLKVDSKGTEFTSDEHHCTIVSLFSGIQRHHTTKQLYCNVMY